MAHGIRINNSSGVTILDTSGEIGRFVTSGSVTLTSPSGYVDISVPGMTNNDSWFVFSVETSGDALATHTITKTSNNMRITHTTPTSVTRTFEYWVIRR